MQNILFHPRVKSIIYFLLTCLCAIPFTLLADTTDVVSPVGPGVVHHDIKIPDVPYSIDVLEIDWPNEWLSLEAAIANDTINNKQLERTTSIAAEHDSAGHLVVGATNGDFFNISTTGIPINIHVQNSQIAVNPIDRAAIGMSESGKFKLTAFSVNALVKATNDSIQAITGINTARGTNQLIFYNRYQGPSTLTNEWGTEVLLRPVDDWVVNDSMRFVVEDKVSGVGDMHFSRDMAVLSGHGNSQTFLDTNVAIEDTLTLRLGFTPDIGHMIEAIGGGPMLLQNGVNVATGTDQHPRTGFGLNADTSKVFMITIDGRQPGYANGMTLPQMASFMKNYLGASDAINLDGGGSTTMVVRGSIVNSPSDPAGERLVGNALLLVSSAPLDTVTRIEISPKQSVLYGGVESGSAGSEKTMPLRLINGDIQQFRVQGWDQYYNPLPHDSIQPTFHADERIGAINPDGLFTASAMHDSGYVWVESSNGIADSAFIIVNTLSRLTIYPKEVVTDSGSTVTLTLLGTDTGGFPVLISGNDAVSWGIDGNAGNITEINPGQVEFMAIASTGTGQITASLGNVTGTAIITIGDTATALLDDFTNLLPYTVETQWLEEDSSVITLSQDHVQSDPYAFKVHYLYNFYPRVPSLVHFQRNFQIPGRPELFLLSLFNDSDGTHFLSVEFEDQNGGNFSVLSTDSLRSNSGWAQLQMPLSAAVPEGDDAVIDYPVTLKSITLHLKYPVEDGGTYYRGTVYLDDFAARYGIPTATFDDPAHLPESYALSQNYPNPFNPVTTISYQLPRKSEVNLSIYNARGEVVQHLLDSRQDAGAYTVTWDASQVSSGIYFYRLQTQDFTDVKKCVVLK